MGENGLRDVERDATKENGEKGNPFQVLEQAVEELAFVNAVA